MSDITNNINNVSNTPESISSLKSEIYILSLNIFVRPPLITNSGNDYKDHRLAYFTNFILPKYDVVCLQEAFSYGSNRILNLIRQAESLGFKYHVRLNKPKPKSFYDFCKFKVGIDGGLLIISRLKITEHRSLVFDKGCSVDKLAYKGSLYARIQLPTLNSNDKVVHLNLFNTHLQASYSNNPDINTDVGALTRTHQLKQLFEFVKQNTAETNTISNNDSNRNLKDSINLIVGDFNINSKPDSLIESKEESVEYRQLIDISTKFFGDNNENSKHCLKFRDLLMEKYKTHPITLGDYFIDDSNRNGEEIKVPKEKILTFNSCLLSAQSLDYAFLLDEENHQQNNRTTCEIEAKVEELFIENNNRDILSGKQIHKVLTQVSDHYGVEIRVKLPDNNK